MLLAEGVWKIGGDVSEALGVVPITVGNVSTSLMEPLDFVMAGSVTMPLLLDVKGAAGPVTIHEHADETFDGVLSHFATKAGRPVVAVFVDAV